jgi:hypothetical protein
VTTLGLKKIPKDALFGVIYIRKVPGERYESYYKTIDVLRPLLCSNEFSSAIRGFYLNHIDDTLGDSREWVVRVSYFVADPDFSSMTSMVTKFFSRNSVGVAKEKPLREEIVAACYGGIAYEEPFRDFLNLETQISLELMEADLLHARCLLATYRWQIRKAELSVERHFQSTLERCSQTYRSMSEEGRAKFLMDLQAWPNPKNYDWAHFMVEMILGADWPCVYTDPKYVTSGKPLSIPEINRKVKQMGFQIPLDWTP